MCAASLSPLLPHSRDLTSVSFSGTSSGGQSRTALRWRAGGGRCCCRRASRRREAAQKVSGEWAEARWDGPGGGREDALQERVSEEGGDAPVESLAPARCDASRRSSAVGRMRYRSASQRRAAARQCSPRRQRGVTPRKGRPPSLARAIRPSPFSSSSEVERRRYFLAQATKVTTPSPLLPFSALFIISPAEPLPECQNQGPCWGQMLFFYM